MTRESDLYKDKIEVSLDGRQIFYLFFGGAVIVGLVFVLGVMVGRRVEARGHLDHAQTQTATDPLAALDRLEGNRGMTFQSTLTGSAAASEVDHAIADLEKSRKAEAAKPAAKKPDAKKPEPKQDAPKVAVKDDKPAPKEVKPEPKPEPKSEPKQEPKIEAKVEPKADAKSEAKPDVKADKKTDAGKPKKHDDAAKSEDKAKFTLQLSSFQDKAEADAFLATIKAAGYQPYVTEAAVDGKGTFYRVRIGSYRTVEAANNAKSELDKNLKKPAQVTKL